MHNGYVERENIEKRIPKKIIRVAEERLPLIVLPIYKVPKLISRLYLFPMCESWSLIHIHANTSIPFPR